MMAPFEETLMAYSDDALGPSARKALTRYLRRNGGAAAIVPMYRETALLLEQAFERPKWEPVATCLPVAVPTGWWQRLWRLDFLAPAQVLRWHKDAVPTLQGGKKSHEPAD